MQLRSFYRLSTFKGFHVRKNTRLSPHAQAQFRVPEWRSLGTGLMDTYKFFCNRCIYVLQTFTEICEARPEHTARESGLMPIPDLCTLEC